MSQSMGIWLPSKSIPPQIFRSKQTAYGKQWEQQSLRKQWWWPWVRQGTGCSLKANLMVDMFFKEEVSKHHVSQQGGKVARHNTGRKIQNLHDISSGKNGDSNLNRTSAVKKKSREVTETSMLESTVQRFKKKFCTDMRFQVWDAKATLLLNKEVNQLWT